ncbi:hypothetical protein LCGC14_0688220 [marine sediment metagenome]|uniref:Uncharacterized protein n=1 Tax=marine sediment metagenome TaxID=412755 RepID=A0A0F9QR49_9ZZZZ
MKSRRILGLSWEDRTAYDREYYETNRDEILRQHREKYHQRKGEVKALRLALIERLGSRCVYCTTQEVLEIDHINGGGESSPKYIHDI